jgi:hypothetical protein
MHTALDVLADGEGHLRTGLQPLDPGGPFFGIDLEGEALFLERLDERIRKCKCSVEGVLGHGKVEHFLRGRA